MSCEVCSTPAGMIVTLGAPQRADFLARGIVRNAAEYDVSG